MIKNKQIYFLLVILFLVGACAPKPPPSSETKDYEEDLSQFVIPYSDSLKKLSPVSPSPENLGPETPDEIITARLDPAMAITDSLDVLLDSLTIKNKDRLYPGYTIQVYSGPDRQSANQAKNKVYQVLPSSKPKISYIQPNFKVRVGEFADRLEAQKMYIQLQEAFPGAMIIPQQIKIN